MQLIQMIFSKITQQHREMITECQFLKGGDIVVSSYLDYRGKAKIFTIIISEWEMAGHFFVFFIFSIIRMLPLTYILEV